MDETLKRIADEATAALKNVQDVITMQARRAGDLVLEAERNLSAVVDVAKDVPEKLMSKFTYVLAGDVVQATEDPMKIYHAHVALNGYQFEVHGLFGANVPIGHYRVLVLLERVK
jgi:hypothetical protein